MKETKFKLFECIYKTTLYPNIRVERIVAISNFRYTLKNIYGEISTERIDHTEKVYITYEEICKMVIEDSLGGFQHSPQFGLIIAKHKIEFPEYYL